MTLKSDTQKDGPHGAGPIEERVTAAPDAEYKVGPGCPPKEYQFPKGKSGNPGGAKPRAPSLAPDLKELLEQVLAKKHTFNQLGKKRVLTLYAAGIDRLVGQYVKGDRHARQELFALAEKVGLDLLGIQKKASNKRSPRTTRQSSTNTSTSSTPDRTTSAGAGARGAVDDDSDDQDRSNRHA
jgi:hypothetical protein